MFPQDAIRGQADPRSVETAVDLLLGGERPLIAAGDGVFWSGAAPELRELAELLRIRKYSLPEPRLYQKFRLAPSVWAEAGWTQNSIAPNSTTVRMSVGPRTTGWRLPADAGRPGRDEHA